MSTGFDPTQAPFDDGSGFAMDDVDPDKPGTGGGGGQLPEGGYCVVIVEVVLQNERGSTEVKCEVLAAKDANLIGRSHTEYLKWPRPEYKEAGNRIAKEQLLAWCYAAKTTNPDEIRARQQARQGFSSAWLNAMVGRHALIFIKHEDYTDANGAAKTSSKAEGRVWAVDNPKGKGIPGWVDTAGEQAVVAANQQTQRRAQQEAAAADPFAGLV
jgi:hypothetical protein